MMTNRAIRNLVGEWLVNSSLNAVVSVAGVAPAEVSG
jgi:hypothetical protein